jgi:putative nucleotidyltransferase with HDIG domain
MRESDNELLSHSVNVAIYSVTLGRALGLPDEGLATLGLSALLHDVGKTAFDIHDPEQAEMVASLHSQVGADMLSRADHDDPAPMLVAYEHHMYLDGSGVPPRAEGYVAHPFSRMIAIADRYENLTNPRDPAEALTPDQAVLQVLREAGTRLDPLFARLFSGALGVFPVGCMVRLSDDTVGVVCRAGSELFAPIVKRNYDGRGLEIDQYDEIDLGAQCLDVVEVVDPSSLNILVGEKL